MLQASTDTIAPSTIPYPAMTAKLHEFNRNYGTTSSICFRLLMQKGDGTTKFYDRTSQPCWGELRSYNLKADGYYKPSDLHNPFPKGTPIGLACVNFYGETWGRYFEWLFSPDSPWGMNLGSTEITYHNGVPYGVVFTNTHFDPTVMANALLMSKNMQDTPSWALYVDKGIHPLVATLLCQQFPSRSTAGYADSYSFAIKIDPWRLWNGKPHNLTPGEKTFFARGNYNRPRVHSIFSGSVHLHPIIRKLVNSNYFSLDQAVSTVAPAILDILKNTPQDPTNILKYEGPSSDTDGDDDTWNLIDDEED